MEKIWGHLRVDSRAHNYYYRRRLVRPAEKINLKVGLIQAFFLSSFFFKECSKPTQRLYYVAPALSKLR